MLMNHTNDSHAARTEDREELECKRDDDDKREEYNSLQAGSLTRKYCSKRSGIRYGRQLLHIVYQVINCCPNCFFLNSRV